MMKIVTKPGCTYCDQAKTLLTQYGIEYVELYKMPEGFKTYPQIWHDGVHIGGFTELSNYLNEMEEF